MNQETRNLHIQHARAELRAGRPVMARWPSITVALKTSESMGNHDSKVVDADSVD
jgi:hypothetical protein